MSIYRLSVFLVICSNLGPDILIAAAPTGAVTSIHSTAMVNICIPQVLCCSEAFFSIAVSYAIDPINAWFEKIK